MENIPRPLLISSVSMGCCIFFVLCFVAVVMHCSVGEGGGSSEIASTRMKASPIHHHLTLDFYSKSCPQLDRLVFSVTSRQFHETPISGPATIRLFFHDCFVEGCDASVLLSTAAPGGSVERDAAENKNLPPEAFDTVNKVKALVESKCPGVVSCADILAVAARDFVHLAGGPYYEVKKGRRDGKVSSPEQVKDNLPSANSTVDDLLRLFARKDLTLQDLVALSGAHTIGFSHCDQFVTRLYDHRGTMEPDPSMDLRLLKALRMSCPRFGGNADITAPFDVRTPFEFDNMYYRNLEDKMGLLASDQALWLDPRTRPVVLALGKDNRWFSKAFAEGMEKLGAIGVKKGKKGEVRRVCTLRN